MMQTETSRELREQVHPAGFLFFQRAFGFLMLFSTLRFWYNGWIEELLLAPKFHFTYDYLSWIQPWPPMMMYMHFLLMGICAFFVGIGFHTRWASLGFFLLFTYVELIEKSNYLNHYYLVSIIAFLFFLLPTVQKKSGKYSKIDKRVYTFLRIQIGLVYIYAGIAKISHDWLIRGEPLYTWLQSYAHLPVVGSLMTERTFALAMGWGGCIFDLTIVGWLLWHKTRPYAYSVLVFFHAILWLMFPIGVFPWLMMISASIFFHPSWCKQWFPLKTGEIQLRPPQFVAVALFCVLQCIIPLRHMLYPGPVNWTEEGFRFSWRVMLVEKAGSLEYEVHKGEQRFFIFPRKELPPFQYRMLTTQPDMIHDYALELAKRYSSEDGINVQVYARSFVWFNGYKSQRYIDPNIDLAAEKRGFHHKSWILPFGVSSEDSR